MNYRNFKMLGKFSIPVPAASSPTQTPWQKGKRGGGETERQEGRERERDGGRDGERQRERERKGISSTQPVVSSGLSYNHYVMRESLLQVDFALS